LGLQRWGVILEVPNNFLFYRPQSCFETQRDPATNSFSGKEKFVLILSKNLLLSYTL
jgi:hypothetical protein